MKKIFAKSIVTAGMLTSSMFQCVLVAQNSARVSPVRSAAPSRRESVGIAFEGGGALGLAHVGVMMWLEEHHIPVDRISGTSMGALVGALFAAGYSPDHIEALAKSKAFETLFTTQPSLVHSSFRRREDRQDMPHALTLGLKGGLTAGDNLIADDQLNALLGDELGAYTTTALNFDDLPIPFRCVASNLTTLMPYIFSHGSLPLAVRASISIPGVFAPVHMADGIMVDGAITDNLPTDVLRNDLHPDVSIAVYLGDGAFADTDAGSLMSVLSRTLSVGTARNVELTRPLADIEIFPAVTALSVTDYGKADLLIKLGFDAAERQRDRLLPLALSDEDWRLYQANLISKKRRKPTKIDVLRIDGPDQRISARLNKQAATLLKGPFFAERASSLVSDIRGEGALDASYETFHVPNPPIDRRDADGAEPDSGLLIHWRPNIGGPPYLLINTGIAAMSANVTSAVVNMRFVDENLGGYGSEFRADTEVGYMTRFGAEHYHPLASTRLYIQPSATYLRRPVYYWENQKRVSERLLQRAGGGLDIGVAVNRRLQVALQYQNAVTRWVLKDGSDSSPTQKLSGTSQSIAGHVFLTNRVSEIASPKGGLVDLTVGHLIHTTGSIDAPFAVLKARQSFSLADVNSFIVSLDASSYFRNKVADPFRFTLGGPLHLSASSVDEFRGTDAGSLQGIYLRRIANLPTGLGQGIYLAAGYEAGSIWRPEGHSILRQDGVAGVLLNTPVGVLTLGGAIGDAGHRKVFFTLGRFF